MVRYKENNTQGWKCTACGNGIYTSYFDEIDSDPTEYSLVIAGTRDVTTEKIQYISKISNINFIEAKNILSKGNNSEIKAKAPLMKEIIIRLRELDIDYSVTPEFKYIEAK